MKHFKDIQYTPSMTYGELLLQNEYEMSCYNMDQADVATQQQMFKLHEEVSSISACTAGNTACAWLWKTCHHLHGTLVLTFRDMSYLPWLASHFSFADAE